MPAPVRDGLALQADHTLVARDTLCALCTHFDECTALIDEAVHPAYLLLQQSKVV